MAVSEAHPILLRPLLAGCVEHLLDVWEPREGLFPFKTELVDGGYVNDYAGPFAARYTITSLLGLAEAARHEVNGVTPGDVADMTRVFLDRRGPTVRGIADLGLLAVLLSSLGEDRDRERTLAAVDGAVAAHATGRLRMQDLAWALWGAAAAAEGGSDHGASLAHVLSALVRSRFVHPDSGLPRHTTRRYRRNLVSFGALAYFLRAMHEAARAVDDAQADSLFVSGVARALELQGPRGEWPWMIDASTGTAIDRYPVFTVHQDSMAMLFLLPALDAGNRAAAQAVDRSLSWAFGDNELGTRMYVDRPFFAYRSIERRERASRLRRYGRSLAYSVTGRPSAHEGARVRLNDECRSYHPGWVLYAWAARC
jgi:hypothetical protein